MRATAHLCEGPEARQQAGAALERGQVLRRHFGGEEDVRRHVRGVVLDADAVLSVSDQHLWYVISNVSCSMLPNKQNMPGSSPKPPTCQSSTILAMLAGAGVTK